MTIQSVINTSTTNLWYFQLSSKWMQMPTTLIPKAFMDEYNLEYKAKYGFIYMETTRWMCENLKANYLIKYPRKVFQIQIYKVPHMPGPWKNRSWLIQYSWVINDFDIKNFNKKGTHHLLNDLKDHFKVEIDWTEGRYHKIMHEQIYCVW